MVNDLSLPCRRLATDASSSSSASVIIGTRRPRAFLSTKLFLATGLFVVATTNLITAAHAFSQLDLDNHVSSHSRQLYRLFKRSALMASRGSSSTETEINRSSSALPPRRNWRISSAAAASSSGGPAISPFEQAVPTVRASDDNLQEAASEASAWSEEAYQSALQLYDRLLHYCSAHDKNNDDVSEDDSNLSQLILSALDILHQAYRLYGPRSVIGSYNGGKDACVILHLMRAAYANFIRNDPSTEKRACQPRTIYFEHEDEFPEVLDFLHETVLEYDLNMVAFQKGTKYPDGLRSIVETNFAGSKANGDRPFPTAFVLGTRAGDPNAGTQGAYAPSSSFMPPFMRINPILTPEWTYANVWEFLRRFDLSYCCLYDEGYTSLGTVKDTMPCPALKKDDLDLSWEEDTGGVLGECGGDYWPAYMLKDWEQERAGRIKKTE